MNYYDPEFEKATRVHDWRNYVSDELKERWWDLDIESRRMIAEMLKEIASNEEWD